MLFRGLGRPAVVHDHEIAIDRHQRGHARQLELAVGVVSGTGTGRAATCGRATGSDGGDRREWSTGLRCGSTSVDARTVWHVERRAGSDVGDLAADLADDVDAVEVSARNAEPERTHEVRDLHPRSGDPGATDPGGPSKLVLCVVTTSHVASVAWSSSSVGVSCMAYDELPSNCTSLKKRSRAATKNLRRASTPLPSIGASS